MTAQARRRRGWIALTIAAALLQIAGGASAPAASAQGPALLDPQGTAVAASGGWAAWSRRDAATGSYALVTRSPQGAISLPALAESRVPFDVELGPSRGSGVTATFSRCAGAAFKGCRLAALELGVAGAAELALAPPGGGSDHEPAIWRGTIAFLRRTPSGSRRRPDNLLVWKIGSRSVRALALPSSRGNARAGWPPGLTGAITGLTFNGKQVAYATTNAVGSFGEATLWFEPIAGRPELIDQETSGAGNVCAPQFVSPVLSGPWLYAYLHACDPSADPRLDRLTRYRHGDVQRAGYTFIHSGDEGVDSVVPDGEGVDWGAEGLRRLSRVAWRPIAPPPAQTFCGRADPFC